MSKSPALSWALASPWRTVWLLIWAEASRTHRLPPPSCSGVAQGLGGEKDGAQVAASGVAGERGGAGGCGAVRSAESGRCEPRAGALSVVLKMPLVRAARGWGPRVPRAVAFWGQSAARIPSLLCFTECEAPFLEESEDPRGGIP